MIGRMPTGPGPLAVRTLEVRTGLMLTGQVGICAPDLVARAVTVVKPPASAVGPGLSLPGRCSGPAGPHLSPGPCRRMARSWLRPITAARSRG